jgi:hypothetical protein
MVGMAGVIAAATESAWVRWTHPTHCFMRPGAAMAARWAAERARVAGIAGGHILT